MMDSQNIQKTGVKKLLLMGERFYHKILPCFRWILSPLRRICTLFNILRPDVWIITGNEISSGHSLTMIFAGRETDKNFLNNLAFGSSCRQNYVGRRWLWRISETVQESGHDCDLMIAEVPRFYRTLLGKKKSIYVPCWISGEIDISSHIKKDSVKTDIRSIRKNRLHFEVTNEPSQLHNFYYNMYVPYITKVHGNRSVIMSYDYVKREFKKRGWHNVLLLIKKEEEYIAGISLLCRKNRAKLWSLGVKNGNSDYVRESVPGALYYFSICYLKAKGFTEINCGRSRPFLKDGVLEFKKKRGGRIVYTSKMGFLIKPLSKTGGIKGFFLNNPLIYEDKTGLNGAIFVASDQSLSRSDFARIYKDHYLRGLSKLAVYRFGEADKILDIVPPEFSDRITMCSVESIF
ncbi:MAG: hypothetical protein WBC05_24695 [Sedimentisphaerales bacterium]